MTVLTCRAAGTGDLTVHLRNPDIPESTRPGKGANAKHRAFHGFREWEGHGGQTVCGRFLLLEEVWSDHEAEDRDPLCPDCFPSGPPPAYDEPSLL